MKLTNQSTVPVYTISGSSTARPLPEWLARKRKRSLKQDQEFAHRIELLQDFEFEEASSCIQVSEDGDWVVSTGTYKPQMHVHYLPNLSLSYARHTNALNQKFILLSSDYSKSLHLQTDRSLEFHTPKGCHYSTRIPRYGRDLIYDRHAAEAIIPSVGVNSDGSGEVFRLNLEIGRYMKSYEVEVGRESSTSGNGSLQGSIGVGSVNAAAIAETSHNLLAFGTSLGSVEFWDPRSRNRVSILPPLQNTYMSGDRSEITSLEFHTSGLSLASGSSAGLVHIFDLRSPKPLLTKDQGYGYPIQTIQFLTPSSVSSSNSHLSSVPKILTSDKRIIKIWNTDDGAPWTSVEPAVDLNSVAWCKDSGMLLTANEGRQQHSFFIPQLGPAPKWCAFLDNLVEEMAEDPNDPSAFNTQKSGETYDNYKFLTPGQLEALSLDHLVGTTSLLRPYMHGYFVAQQLYEEARLINNPEIWEEQREKSIREKIEKQRESRIRGSKKINVKVNKRLAERIIEREEKNERRKAKRALLKNANSANSNDQVEGEDVPYIAKGVLGDSRFTKLFEDVDFAVDETSQEFQSLNSSTKPTTREHTNHLTAVEKDELDDVPVSDSSNSDDSESEGEKTTHHIDSSHKNTKISTGSYKKSGHLPRDHESRRPKMYVTSSNGQKSLQDTRERSFGSRAAKYVGQSGKRKDFMNNQMVGEKQITFKPHARNSKIFPDDQNIAKPLNGHKGRRSASGNTIRSM